MENIEIARSALEVMWVDARVGIATYAMPLAEFCRLTHTGRATVIALINAGYLRASTVNGEVMILSGTGEAALQDFLNVPAPKTAKAALQEW